MAASQAHTSYTHNNRRCSIRHRNHLVGLAGIESEFGLETGAGRCTIWVVVVAVAVEADRTGAEDVEVERVGLFVLRMVGKC